jgi:uncharacterized YigZ family protein
VEQVKDVLAEIRAEMPDASHHVYAFRIGYGNSVIEGKSDDGEPSGTAGPPTLAVLRGTHIGDIVIVTTRYFGGTKLGTGGLVRAYSDAAKTALSTLKTEIKIPKRLLGFDIHYSYYEQTKRLIAQYEGTIQEENFGGEVSIIALFPLPSIPNFRTAITELTAGQVELVLLSDD